MNTITLHRLSLVFIAATLVACQTKPVRSPAAPTPPIPAADIAGATRYQVDAAASSVHILVYRAGAAAHLGHNHVVSSSDLHGTVYLQKDLTRSRIDLELPVANLIVDDAKARSGEGQDFAAEVPQDAREGTRHNLLRSEVLDAERFPTIALQSKAMTGTLAQLKLTMRITIKGVARDVPVTAAVVQSNATLTAHGEFTIKQTDFGITPFSVALGALQVQDQLRMKFSVVCREQQ